MSNTVHVNLWEKFCLFDIFDAARKCGTNHDHADLMDRLEHELGRYATDAPAEQSMAKLLHDTGYENESSTTAPAQTE